MKQCTKCHKTCDAGIMAGSGWIELILWFCYIIPGLIYTIWRRSGEPTVCPHCKTNSLNPYENKNTSFAVRNEVSCEWCAEPILANAKICKHCKKEVNPQPSVIQPVQDPSTSTDARKVSSDIESTTMSNGFKFITGSFLFIIVASLVGALMERDPANPKTAELKIDEGYVCKAGVAASMGRDIGIMNATKTGYKYQIDYVRPNDQSRWVMRCWIKNDRIMWQTVNEQTGELGRVRNSQWDEVLTYSVKHNELKIRIQYSDSSVSYKNYLVPKQALMAVN